MLPIDMLHSIARERQHTLRQEAEHERLVRSARAAKPTAKPVLSSAAPRDLADVPVLRAEPAVRASVPVCVPSAQLV